jgi:rod shape-determining protein MreD
MHYAILAILVYLAVALQTTLVDVIQIGRIAPQIPAMVAVAVVLLHRGSGALVFVAAIGLLEDALWPGRMGISMAWYLLLGWCLLEGAERFDLKPLNRRIAATALYAGLLALCVGTTRLAVGEPTVGFSAIAASAAGIGLYTAVVSVPFWFLLDRFEDALRQRLTRYEV